MKHKRGRCVKKNKQLVDAEPEELTRAPHSFVINRGLPGAHVLELTKDFRRVMEPFTASALKVRKKNKIKDFVSIAGILHVSHLCSFSRTENSLYFKIARLPRGPTLSFKVHSFALSRDVVSTLKKQLVIEEAFKHSPLVVLNSFTGEGLHMKLMTTTFQNMFPTINLTNVNLSTIRRTVLLNYNPTTKLIDFRHYAIKVVPVGLSKGVKKVIQGKVPNLARCEDIGDFFTKTGALSESEFEDDETGQVELPQKLSSRGNLMDQKSSIRLTELGPRMTLQLIKVEDGLMDGEVLFHDLIVKSEEEKAAILKKRLEKKKLKENRKRLQEMNVAKKETEKLELKKKSRAGMDKDKHESDKMMERAVNEANENVDHVDDDEEYYRNEVGSNPEKGLFDAPRVQGTKRPFKTPAKYNKSKKPKLDSDKKEDKKNKGKKEDFSRDSKMQKNPKYKVKASGSKKFGGRGNHPKYGWRNQEKNENFTDKKSSSDRKSANDRSVKKNKKR